MKRKKPRLSCLQYFLSCSFLRTTFQSYPKLTENYFFLRATFGHLSTGNGLNYFGSYFAEQLKKFKIFQQWKVQCKIDSNQSFIERWVCFFNRELPVCNKSVYKWNLCNMNTRGGSNTVVPDFTNSVYGAAHVILSCLVSFSLLFFLHLFLDIPSCLGMAW